MKTIVFAIGLLVAGLLNAQNTTAIYGFAGTTIGRLSFEGFDDFVDSYNTLNQPNGLTKLLDFKQTGIGYSGGAYFRLGKFITGLQGVHIATRPSTASFGENQTRSFQFRYSSFDLMIGMRFGSEQWGCVPYFTLTTQAMQLYSWYEYANGVQSFGSETSFSGVYTSWKSVGKLGLRLTYEKTKWGCFFDATLPVNKNEYLGGDFAESSSATDSNYFPAYAGQSPTDAITDGLKESYRQFTFSLGVSYKIAF